MASLWHKWFSFPFSGYSPLEWILIIFLLFINRYHSKGITDSMNLLCSFLLIWFVLNATRRNLLGTSIPWWLSPIVDDKTIIILWLSELWWTKLNFGDVTTKRQVMPILYLSISSEELVLGSQQAIKKYLVTD